MKVIIYSKDNCPNCDTIKNILKEACIKFDERNVMENVHYMDELYEHFPMVRSLPGIVVDDDGLATGVSSVNEVRKLVADHKLKGMTL